MTVGRPKCGLRCRMETLLTQYPPKIAREIAYAEAFQEYYTAHPNLSLSDFNKEQARLRNHIRVLQHKIKTKRGEF